MNSRGMRKKMTVLVDSWAWIEYFKGTLAGEKVKELLENSQDKIIVSTVNIAEVYNSFLRDYSYPDNNRYAKASRNAIKQRSYICEVDEKIAVDSAKIMHEKKWGLGDSIIYATAKREEAKVMTGDPHFRGLSDVIFLER
ncbi:MAG: type II toxin-antitoxin system VapC family toxin [Candidatus Methanoperedens sp.]|nr:type II toxin-antitoxin system VapC family toxin [Candidatus Methanoperedens sp.]